MKFPTLAIQLKSDAGVPIDTPDDWLDTVMQIAAMIHSKYRCGVDVVYGEASQKGFNIMETEVNQS